MNIKKTYMKKKITILLFLLFTYSIASAQEMKGMDMNKKETKPQVQPVTYTCPMHHEIHATKPGNCPKCGMKLIKEIEVPKPQKKAKEKDIDMDNMQMDKRVNMFIPNANPDTKKTFLNQTPPHAI